jgi:hypothetical protein
MPKFLTGYRYSQEVPVMSTATINYESLGPNGEAQ